MHNAIATKLIGVCIIIVCHFKYETCVTDNINVLCTEGLSAGVDTSHGGRSSAAGQY